MVMDIEACIYRDIHIEWGVDPIYLQMTYDSVNVNDSFGLHVKNKSKDYMPRARPFVLIQWLEVI